MDRERIALIEKRKTEHIKICAKENVAATRNYWEHIHFIHNALPEIDFDDIDLTSTLFGKKLRYPIVIAAMTGGCPAAMTINRNLARACEELQIGMGVGSQRAGLMSKELAASYEVVKEFDVPLMLGNIGAPQIIIQKGKTRPAVGSEEIGKVMEMVGADVVAVHLNFLQEITQHEGDHCARGVLERLDQLSREFPLIAKETGAGISREVAEALAKTHIRGIDVGGVGGTSFSAVEVYRSALVNDDELAEIGRTFWNWGVPTPVSVHFTRQVTQLPIIATGGVLNGLHAAKALALGANAAGIAMGVLNEAMKSTDAVVAKLEKIIKELTIALFLSSSRDIHELKKKDLIIEREVDEWLQVGGQSHGVRRFP